MIRWIEGGALACGKEGGKEELGCGFPKSIIACVVHDKLHK